MSEHSTIRVFVNPLDFSAVDERDPGGQEACPGHEAIIDFLCEPGVESTPEALVSRYKEIAIQPERLFLVPAEPRILEKLIWPLRNAQGAYMLGNYVGTIALCGMVAEMVALLLFEISEIGINKVLLRPKQQELLFGRTFENLGQNQRVGILKTCGVIDQPIVDAFDAVRTKRKRYLHFWSQDHDTLPGDAEAVYAATHQLVARLIGQKFQDGKLVLPPELRRYLKRKGQSATKMREGCKAEAESKEEDHGVKEKPNFRPRVVEYKAPYIGVELEFHEEVPGLNGDTIVIHLQPGVTFEQAERLRNMLSDMGAAIEVTNPQD